MKKIIGLLLVASMAIQPFCAFAEINSDTTDTETAKDWSIRSCMSDSSGAIDEKTIYHGKKSIKLENKTPSANQKFLSLWQSVSLEDGKKYRFGFVAKGDGVEKARVSLGSSSYSIRPYGNSLNWSEYEFSYEQIGNQPATLAFILEGAADGLWIDDVYITEDDSTENLVKNPGFEERAQAEESAKEENILENHDSFSIDDIKKSYATIGYIPISKKSVKVDGSFDEWGEDEPKIIIPANEKQWVKYLTGSDLDINCDVSLAYDDTYLYLALKVHDNVHYAFNNSNYWTGDSIQFAVTGVDDKYGNEIGIVHDEENQKSGIFAPFADSVNERIQLFTKREGEETYYDIGLPWDAIFSERPDEIKLDILVNDNDGMGRIGGIDFSGGGIHQTKTNTNFPIIRMMPDNIDYYGWIDGASTVSLGADEKYNLFVVNNGDEREFSIDIPEVDYHQSMIIPANSGKKIPMSLKFPDVGERELLVDLSAKDKSYKVSKTVTCQRSHEQLKALQKECYPKIQGYISELDKIITQCDGKGLSVTYLTLGQSILQRCLEWMAEDEINDFCDAIEFYEYSLTEIYERTKQIGEGYLDGSIEPLYVPQYMASVPTVEDGHFVAMVDNNGVSEKRPVNFLGYLTWFYLLADDLPLMKNIGANVIQTEVRMWDVIKAPDINTNWKTKDGTYHEINYEVTDKEKKSGKYSLKIVDPTEKWTLNNYRYIYQTVSVKPNTTYSYGLSAKGKNVSVAWFTVNNGANRTSLNDTYDWRSFSGEYTTGDQEHELVMKIYLEAKCDELYLDDLYISEQGSNINLLSDPGFESGESYAGQEYSVDYNYVESVRKTFQKAEENDVRIDLLLAGHNMAFLMGNYPEFRYTGGGFYLYNMNAPKVLELYREFIKALIPAVADYKSFGTVCLTNEPAFNATDASVADFYREDWIKYLKEIYNNDLDLLNYVYKTEYGSFEEVPMNGGEGYSAFEYDRKEFADRVFANWHSWCANEVKKYAPNAMVHAKLMGHIGSSEAHGDRAQTLIGCDIEKFAEFSDLNGNDFGAHVTNDVISVERQLLLYDLQRSVKNAPVVNSEDHCFGGYITAFGDKVISSENGLNADDNSDSTAINLWSGAIHGRGGSTVWIWERSDLERAKAEDYYAQLVPLRPDAIYKIGKVSLDLNRLIYEVSALQEQPAEVGVIYSTAGRLYNISFMNTMYNVYCGLIHSGQKVQVVTDSKPESMEILKVLFVPEVNNAKRSMLDEIKKLIDNGGRVVLLGNNCLKFDEHNLPHDESLRNYIIEHSTLIDTVTDGRYIKTPNMTETKELVEKVLEESKLNRVVLINNKTNKPVENTDYFATTYNGDLIVQASYLNGYAEGDVDIRVEVDGKPVGEFMELVGNQKYDGVMTISPCQPILLKIPTNNPFIDTIGHWAEEDIIKLTNEKIISGVSDTMFAPDKKITRGEFTTLLARMLDLKPIGKSTYTDLSDTDWFADAAIAAKENGIIPENREEFLGNEQITREEMAFMINQALPENVSENKEISFSDGDLVEEEFALPVKRLSQIGLISGYEDGSYRPKQGMTRSEAVKVLSELFEYMQ